jgi:dephospho-CoA kinase
MDGAVVKLRRPFCVGLTGGIGSGKSTVAALFAERGVEVVDTDRLARELVEPGQEALAEIATQIGAAVLTAAGRLDRAALRQRIGREPETRRRLEAILHPRIRALAGERVYAATGPYVLLVIPLLAENRDAYGELLDRVLVVDCSPERQLERVIRRDAMDAEHAQAILGVQASRAARLAMADDILSNEADGDREDLALQVAALDMHYKALAVA